MQLHSKETGQGTPLLLLHGLFGSSDNWYYLSQTFAVHYRVFAFDQRNHGQSPHSPEMNYSLLADDLAEFMAAHNLSSAIVLGHSLGGKTAMQFALQYPALVEKLIVADMAPRAYAPSHHKIFAALLALDLSAYPGRSQMEETLAADIPSLLLRRFLLKNLGRDQSGKFFWKINLPALAENYARLREPIASPTPYLKPTLFICGGQSNYVTPADEPLIHQLFPNARIETIPEASHWLHADQPGEFARHVLNFLAAP
jgi:pimeloyl-ACP methyl ester carboxylesterase